MASSELYGKDSSSTQDEQRIKKLFQACDTNRDGYIDSQDLLAICRELNLEHSLEELMKQLGADSNGQISYEQFLKRRLDLRPEIDALKCPTDSETIDCASQGRLDSWEWDSGARDLSPVPQKILNNRESDCESQYERKAVQKMLDDQAQRYEEQITELHSVIAELTRKLQQQRTLAIVEEDENSEIGDTSLAEQTTSEQIDEISEQNCDLISNQSDTSQDSNKEQSVDEEAEMQVLPETVLKPTTHEANIVEVSEKSVNPQNTWPINSNNHCHDISMYRTVRSSQEGVGAGAGGGAATVASPPIVTKMAERVRLKRAVEQQTNQDQNVNKYENFEEFELVKLGAQLDHARAQNALLALTLDDTKEQCNRLSLLCGKYESNAVALSMALGMTDSAIEAYDVLLALLETELSLDESRPDSVENRRHVELAAHQLLARLDQSAITCINISGVPGGLSGVPNKWTPRHEARLREHVSRLKQERVSVRNTCVQLESIHLDGSNAVCANCKTNQNQGGGQHQNTQHDMRKMDLETAVLLQEMMSLREQKAELVSRLVQCERDRDNAINRLEQQIYEIR